MNVYLAEFPGTAILILSGGGVYANVNLKRSVANGADWIITTAGWGLVVTVDMYATGQFPGVHLGPAVSLALALDRNLDRLLIPDHIVAQMLGAIIGATIVWLIYLPHWKATEGAGAELGVFSTASTIKNYFANFLSEIIGTIALTLGILLIGVNRIANGLNPLIVGALIAAIGLSSGGVTGYAINPARNLSPRIAHAILPTAGKSDLNRSYTVVPILGPTTGGLLGVVAYTVFYKHTFSIGCATTTVVAIITLILDHILNKSSKKGDIGSIY